MTDELRALRDRLLQEPAIARFPQLQLRMREEMDGLFAMRQAESEKKLRELVEMEEVNDGTRRAQPPRAVQRRHLSLSLLPTTTGVHLDGRPGVPRRARRRRQEARQPDGRLAPPLAPRLILLDGPARAQQRRAEGDHALVRGCHESVYGYMFDRIARQPPKDVLAEPEEVETKRRADMETLAKPASRARRCRRSRRE